MASTTFTHRNLPRLLLQAREAVLGQFRPNLRAHGLTDQQWRVLRVLGESGPLAVDTGWIAREAFLLAPSLSGVLTRMERNGWVVRARCPQDARRTLVKSSAEGKRLIRALSRSIEAHYSHLASGLGATDLDALYALLDRLIALESADHLAMSDAISTVAATANAASKAASKANTPSADSTASKSASSKGLA